MSFAPEKYVINNLNFIPLIPKHEIDVATIRIASQINEDYKNSTPIFLITLKGAVFFAINLLRYIKLDCEIETISARSYGQKMESSGNVKIKFESKNLQNRDVIIIEDVIDTGYTLEKLKQVISLKSPRSLAVASLLAKPEKFCTDIKIDYLGFNVPPKFVIGEGLDFDEKGRNLSGIYVLES